MPTSTSFTCPNCDERRTVVVTSGTDTATFECPNCDEPIVVSFSTD